MGRKEVIQAISDIVQAYYYVQAENNLDDLIWEGRMLNLKMGGRVIKA